MKRFCSWTLLSLSLCSPPAVAQRLVPTPPTAMLDGETCRKLDVCRAYSGIRFFTPTTGYVFDGLAMFKTIDAGTTWTPVLGREAGRLASLGRVKFLDAETFFVSGKQFLRTTDGGRTFQELTGEVPALWAPGKTHAVLDFSFIDRQRGWAIGTPADKSPALLFTDSSGLSWRVQRRIRHELGDPMRIWMFDEQEGLLFARRTVARTRDGGARWDAVAGAPQARRMKCTRSGACLALKASGAFAYISTDRGRSWQETSTSIDPDRDTVYNFKIFSANLAVIVGTHNDFSLADLHNMVGPETPIPAPPPDRGLLVHWDGAHWQRMEYSEFGRIRTADYVTEQEIWASADMNGIIHSNDGGQTWEFVLDYYRQKALTPSPVPTTPAPSPSS